MGSIYALFCLNLLCLDYCLSPLHQELSQHDATVLIQLLLKSSKRLLLFLPAAACFQLAADPAAGKAATLRIFTYLLVSLSTSMLVLSSSDYYLPTYL